MYLLLSGAASTALVVWAVRTGRREEAITGSVLGLGLAAAASIASQGLSDTLSWRRRVIDEIAETVVRPYSMELRSWSDQERDRLVSNTPESGDIFVNDEGWLDRRFDVRGNEVTLAGLGFTPEHPYYVPLLSVDTPPSMVLALLNAGGRLNDLGLLARPEPPPSLAGAALRSGWSFVADLFR